MFSWRSVEEQRGLLALEAPERGPWEVWNIRKPRLAPHKCFSRWIHLLPVEDLWT